MRRAISTSHRGYKFATTSSEQMWMLSKNRAQREREYTLLLGCLGAEMRGKATRVQTLRLTRQQSRKKLATGVAANRVFPPALQQAHRTHLALVSDPEPAEYNLRELDRSIAFICAKRLWWRRIVLLRICVSYDLPAAVLFLPNVDPCPIESKWRFFALRAPR